MRAIIIILAVYKLVQVNYFHINNFCHFAQNKNFLTTKDSRITVNNYYHQEYNVLLHHA